MLEDILTTGELTRVLISHLPGGAAFVVDHDLRYHLAEGEALAIAGFKPDDFVGRTIFEVLPPELAASYEPMYRQALAGEPFEHEHNAHNHTYLSRGTPLRSEDGQVYAVLAVSYDITERKHVEDERKRAEVVLRESEARLQSIANLVPDLLWDSEPDGSTNWYNQRWMEYTGQTFEQAIGWGWTDAIHPDDREGAARRYREAVEQGMPLQQEHRIRRHDGAYRWFVVKASPLKDESGKVIKMYGAATDIHEQRVALEVLRESEAKYRSLFETMDEGYLLSEVIFDANGKPIDIFYLEANPAAVRLAGRDFCGQRMREIDPNYEEYWYEIYGHVALTGECVRTERYAEPHDRWFDFYAFKVGGQESRRVAVVFNDITDRKRFEQRQAYMLQLSDALRSLSDAVEIQATVTHITMNFFNADRCYYCEMLNGDVVIRQDASREDLPSVVGVYPLQNSPIFKSMLSAGQPFVFEDVHTTNLLDENLRQSCLQLQIIAGMNVPVIKQGEPVGILCLNQTTPRQWTGFDLAEEIADRTWATIERARAEADLRESEEKYRSLFTSINEGYALCELIYGETEQAIDWRLLEVNPAFERLTGLSQTRGKTAIELNQPIHSNWLETFSQVAQTGEPTQFEQYIEGLDYWFDVNVSRLDADSRHIIVVFNNITERKRNEAQLRESEEQQAFLLKFSDVLRAEPDADSVASRAVRMLAEHLHLDRCWLSEVFEQQGIATVGPEYHRPDLPPMSGVYRLSDYPETMRQLLTQSMVIHDVASDPDFSDSEKALLDQLHLRALLIVSLRKGQNQVIWALAATVTTPRHWNESERVLLEQVSERTWAALERARAEAALREAELQRVREQAAREQERQRAESLAALDRAKTLFFSNVSHEFRTPLTLILAPLQDALKSVDEWMSESVDETCTHQPMHPSTDAPINPWTLKQQLQLAHRNSLRLLKLVNTLLDFSRIEAGRMEAVYEPTDLATYTAELASVFRSAIEGAGLQLMVDCPPLPSPVYVDREMWEKIVLNLLSNAFKFTLEGEIILSLRAEPNCDRQAPTAIVHDLTAEPQSLSVALETLTSDPERLTSEPEMSASDLETLTAELEPSPSRLKTPPSKPETSGSDLETLTTELEPSPSKLKTPPSKPELSDSELEPSTSPWQVILEIHDTGVGIAPEHQSHLFERFYQVRGTQARTHEGSGIGLALVHELVRLHGGTIAVSSTMGAGTCFTIAIPFGTDHLPHDRLHLEGDRQPVRNLASTAMGATGYVEEAKRWLPRGENGEWGMEHREALIPTPDFRLPTPPSSRVLVVDDNADMREYLTRILSEQVQVEAVADGATALAVAQAQVPDLILSDVMMPGLDGFELLRALRTDPRTQEIPIILLSARAGEEAIVEGLQAGADDYLIKPFSAQELVSRVTTHLQMTQRRRVTLDQERTINRRKDEFMSVVSHELNTPLVSILGWTRMLRSHSPSPETLAKVLDTIERNATLQAKLVQDLLDLSRITAGKFHLSLHHIELQPVIATAIATVTQTAIEKNIHLTWQEHPIAPVVIMGDSDRLSQVLINLLTNAIKFTPTSGSIKVELSVEGVEGKGVAPWQSAAIDHVPPSPHPPIHSPTPCAKIQVTDTGIGITAEFLPHVFDRFRQADRANATKGLGSGLAIARHIVELHNGTIEADSAGTGKGATFTVRLPMP